MATPAEEAKPKSLRESLDEAAYRLAGLEVQVEDVLNVKLPLLMSRIVRLEDGILALYQGDREKVSEVMRRKLK